MASVMNGVKNANLGSKDGPLFDPVKVGDYQLSARYVYAPLTRCRALGELVLCNFFSAARHAGLSRKFELLALT